MPPNILEYKKSKYSMYMPQVKMEAKEEWLYNFSTGCTIQPTSTVNQVATPSHSHFGKKAEAELKYELLKA